jgi:hypothetical protein
VKAKQFVWINGQLLVLSDTFTQLRIKGDRKFCSQNVKIAVTFVTTACEIALRLGVAA